MWVYLCIYCTFIHLLPEFLHFYNKRTVQRCESLSCVPLSTVDRGCPMLGAGMLRSCDVAALLLLLAEDLRLSVHLGMILSGGSHSSMTGVYDG